MMLTKPLPRLLSSALFTLPMVFASSGIAFAEDLTFTLYNETSATLMYLYISPTNVDDWEEDVLGNDILDPGESGEVTIADDRRTCIYDILGVFDDGDQVEDYKINLCTLGSYSFTEN
jgi:hypothetical protein